MIPIKHLDMFMDAFMDQETLEIILSGALDRLEQARKEKDPERITRDRLEAESIAKNLELALDRTEQARIACWRELFGQSVAKLEAEIQPLLNEVACYWRLSMPSVSFVHSGVLNGISQRIDDNLPNLDKYPIPIAPVTSRGLDRADREI
ncbi:protein of unknown function [Sterolibacterium denitrificans]|uniref:Uncharacterized protein n=1 Tax=Sterolibacterium denitrificans TaxID=157592 RepID=A0A7Z7HRZ6_9PROT|nr:hypothetical protein [Sterolibacterium denitrificans]SMB28611.1 protein of unknown function [Sterolibacterium denitrificans]